MSQPVVLGFTAASSVLIVASQLPAVLGVRAAGGNPLLSAWDVVRDPGSWLVAAAGFATVQLMLLGRRLHRCSRPCSLS